ncbi:SEL1-like repeat protein [Acinetobacter sp. P1(2025)]|uniref:SEL1-like repeat protein n=1 Tax=Acinetobacter sp. P1(2025) TaxID=3446120 RepID=UPI003F536406
MFKKSLITVCLFGLIGCSPLSSQVSSNTTSAKDNDPITIDVLNSQEQQEAKKTTNALGLYQMGSMYDEGGSRKTDLKKAQYYYQEAVKLGSVDALNALGLIKIKNKDYEGAKRFFDQAAAKDDEIAYFNLGNLAMIDRTQPEENKLALDMYSKSAEKGYAPAMVALGDMYSTGKGITPDIKKAEQYYQKGADANDETAINRLALLYLLQDGLDTEEDTANAKKTFALIQRAANNDNPQALYVLSMAYQNGYMVKTNEDKGLEYLEKSAKLGWPEAEYSLAYLYLMGYNVKADTAKAVDLFTKSADHGYSNAQNNLGMLYLKGEVIPKDLVKAKKYLSMGAIQGNPMAAFNLSSAYALNMLTPPNQGEAKRLALFAADNEYTPAINKVVEYYAQGQYGFEKDNEKAREYLNKSIALEDSDAMLMLANAYYVGGYGYAKDLTKANEWMEKAKSYDNPNAQKVENLWRNMGRSETSLERGKHIKEKS